MSESEGRSASTNEALSHGLIQKIEALKKKKRNQELQNVGTKIIVGFLQYMHSQEPGNLGGNDRKCVIDMLASLFPCL